MSGSPAVGAIRDGGIDPANLGKGEWLFHMSSATNQLGGYVPSVTNENSLMLYLKSQGTRYVIVKAATSDQLFNGDYAGPQFTSNLVESAHANGLWIFGYNRSYGQNIPGEIAIADYVFSQGADGFVWDAEAEWESHQTWIGTNGPALAWQLCSAVRSNWPNKFLAHSPFAIVGLHSSFPYKEFGYWSDAVMPQIYHFSATRAPSAAINWADVNWTYYQNLWSNLPPETINGVTVYWTNAIKVLVPIQDVYGPPYSAPTPDKDVQEFIDYLAADPNTPAVGGYAGANFFRADLHDAQQWTYISAGTLGATPGVVNNLVLDEADASVVGAATSVRTFYLTNNTTPRFEGAGTGTDTNSFGTNYVALAQGSGANYVEFTPNVLVPGDYTVYQWHPYRADASAGVPFEIVYNGGSTTVYANQQTNAGNWSLLGTFNFAAGSSGRIRVTDAIAEPGGVALADGIKLVFASPATVASAPPSGLTASAASSSRIDLTWNNHATNAVHNVVARASVAGGPYVDVAVVPWSSSGWSDAGLAGDTTYYYVVRSVNAAGASGNSGEASATTLPAPPQIVVHPQSRTVVVGSTVTFTVAASGAAPLSYQWRHDGSIIGGATQSSYTLTSAQVSDAGAYSVVVTNDVGSATSGDATLTVVEGMFTLTVNADAGGSVSKSPNQASYVAGTVVTVTATPGVGHDFGGWSGDITSADNPLFVTVLSNLAVAANFVPSPTDIVLDNTNAAVTFSGSWAIGTTAAGRYGPDYGFSSTIASGSASTATYRPTITVPGYYSIYVMYPQGGNRAFSTPFKIQTDGASIEVPVNQQVNGGTWFPLVLQVAHLSPGNDVYVEISNLTGYSGYVVIADAVRFQLYEADVLEPLVLSQPQSQVVGPGGMASFSVTATGAAPLSYFWQRNGEFIAGATDSSYTTNNVQLSDSGSVFSCLVSNEFGTILSSGAVLTVRVIPTPVFLGGNYLYLPINTNGVFIAESTGGRFNPDGTGGVAGSDFWWPGTPVYNYAIGVDGAIHPSGSFTSLTLSNLSSGALHQALLEGLVTPGLSFSRDISFATDSKVIRVVDTLQNIGATSLSNVVTLDSTDPDQDALAVTNSSFSTLNDVVSVNRAYDMVVATGPASGLSLGFCSDSGLQIPSATGFENTDPYACLSVVDPEGESNDIAINLAQNYGTLPPGHSRSVVWYMVFGTNQADVIAAFATNVPPSIVAQPESVTTNLGAAVTFAVEAAGGTAPLSYQWLKNDAPLADDASIYGTMTSTLVLTNVVKSDEGSYSVLVTNQDGSVTSAVATLTVLDPFITSQPVGQHAHAGETVTLSVVAGGTDPLSYQWLRDGTELAQGTGASLTLNSLQGADAGDYQVVVSNLSGSVTSEVAVLMVNLAAADAFDSAANGAVYATAVQADGKILVGGEFTTLGGQPRHYLGRLNSDGTLDTTFNPGADYLVYSLTLQPDGKILVGGYFATLAGQTRNYLGRLNSDGTLDATFNPGPSSGVYCIALQADGRILVGGDFTALGGQTRNYLGRLNSDGALDTTFDPNANSAVYSLAVQADGKVLASGWFSTLGGQPRHFLGRLHSNGTLDTTFNPGADYVVNALAVQADGRILAGGWFSTLGGQTRYYLARLNSDGTADTTFNPGPDGGVNCLAVQADGSILVGGHFSILAGEPRYYLGRLNDDGTADTTFNPGAGYAVYSLAVQADGKTLVGGAFSTLAGQPRYCLGRLNATAPATQDLTLAGSTVTWLRGGSSPEVWRTSFESSTDHGTNWLALGAGSRVSGGWELTGISAAPDANIRARGFAAGGFFNGSGWFVESIIGPLLLASQPANRTNHASTTATFSVEVAGSPPVSYQWLKGGEILSDGGTLSGAHASTLTLSNVLGADAGGYSVVISNSFGAVASLVATLTVIDPTILSQPLSQQRHLGESATLSVSAAGTEPLEYQWWKDGQAIPQGTDSSLTLANLQGADAGSYRAVVSNPHGSTTSEVAVLTVNLASADAFDAGANGPVYATAIQADGKILVGGEFTTLGSQPCGYLGRLNSDGTLDTTFNPGASQTVMSLAVQPDGRILVAGWFNTLGGQPRSCLGRLNPDGSLDTTFSPGANDVVYSLAVQPDGKILVGGWFNTLGSQPRNYLGRLNADGSLDTTFNPGADGVVISLAVQADGNVLVGGWFSLLAGQPRNCLGRLNPDGALDTTFDPGADGSVNCVAVQADGRILVGGWFSLLGGQPRYCIGRLDRNGTLDTTFNPEADNEVVSLALQADGKILAGGWFSTLGGQARNHLGRLNSNGTPDITFNPGANSGVLSLAVQADGRILAGGSFSTLGGQTRQCLARLNQTEPATQRLTLAGSTLTWLCGGTCPEFWRTTLDVSTNGTDWLSLAAGTRLAGPPAEPSAAWEWTNLSVSAGNILRARGFVTGGGFDASNWFVETNLVIGAPSIVAQPVSLTNSVGTDATFGVVAAGTSALSYQWCKDGTNLLGATSADLTLTNIQESDQGAYAVVVSNAFGSVVSSEAMLVINQAPIADASATQPVVVSANGTNAAVVLNGTRSADPDGDPLQHTWYQDGNPDPISQGPVASVVLPVGTNALLLAVHDGMLMASQPFTVEVLTTTQALDRLIALVKSTWPHPHLLVATLRAALGSIERGRPILAIIELWIFQYQVRAWVQPHDAVLAATLINAAQQVINALRPESGHPGGWPHCHVTSVHRQPNGQVHIQFSGQPGAVYILEASTNFVEWQMLGVPEDKGNGTFEFEDPNAAIFPNRFYRLVSP